MNFATTKLNGVSTITSSVTHTFLENMKPEEGQKKEYLLPMIIEDLLVEDKAQVKVLETKDKWFGVTYKEDKQVVVDSIKKLHDEGKYPAKL